MHILCHNYDEESTPMITIPQIMVGVIKLHTSIELSPLLHRQRRGNIISFKSSKLGLFSVLFLSAQQLIYVDNWTIWSASVHIHNNERISSSSAVSQPQRRWLSRQRRTAVGLAHLLHKSNSRCTYFLCRVLFSTTAGHTSGVRSDHFTPSLYMYWGY